MRVSVEPAAWGPDAGGVGCWSTSAAARIVSSWVSSISTLRQLDLSSSGGHEVWDDGVAAMRSWLEGVGIWSAPGPARLQIWKAILMVQAENRKEVSDDGQSDAHGHRCVG